jgi:hypothetical protein
MAEVAEVEEVGEVAEVELEMGESNPELQLPILSDW